jgi:ATP phosphoribosyltransferase regulatory subunit
VKVEATVPAPVLAAIRAPFEGAGGATVETPLAERLGIYLDLAGEGLRERLFVVQGPGREDHCLRPDFTVGIARAHLTDGAGDGRYTYEGSAFRVAPPGSGRSEQFLQIGLEAYERGEAVDAEIVLIAWRAAAAGGRTDLGLVLGDVALFGTFLRAIGVGDRAATRLTLALSHAGRLERELTGEPVADAGPLTRLLAGLGEDEAVAVLQEIWGLAGIEPVGGRSAAEIVHRLSARAALTDAPRLSVEARDLIRRYLAIADEPSEALEAISRLAGSKALAESLASWRRRLAGLDEIPVSRMRFAAGFHRPFGYYDGMLFEVRSAALGDEQPVAAGGRYDGLPARLGRPLETGAVGCMVRPTRAWKDSA